MELGAPIAYTGLDSGVPVYCSDGELLGKVTHVLAAEKEDVFDGIIIGEHAFGLAHRFADRDDIAGMYEQGVVLNLDHAAAEQLPKPTANPSVIRDDPAESNSEFRHDKLHRAWNLISGKSPS